MEVALCYIIPIFRNLLLRKLMMQKLEYIHSNAVAAGFLSFAEDYKY